MTTPDNPPTEIEKGELDAATGGVDAKRGHHNVATSTSKSKSKVLLRVR